MRPFSFIRRLSLTQRLLALTLAASLPGLFALVYSSIDLRNTRYGEVRAEALRNVHFVVSEIDQIFDGIEGVLHAVSQASEVHAGNGASCTDYITRVRAQLAQLTSIIVANTDGSLRCYSEGKAPSVNLADRYYFREAMATQAFSIGNYSRSRVSERNLVPMALPVIENGAVAYVMVAGLNIDWLGQQIRDRGLARGSTITVADRNGIIIAREPNAKEFIGTSMPAHHITLLSEKAGTRDAQSRDGVARILAFVPAPETPFGLYVSSGISREEAFGAIDRSLRNSLVLFGLGACIAFFLTWMMGEGIIRRPLMLMVATAEAWRRGYEFGAHRHCRPQRRDRDSRPDLRPPDGRERAARGRACTLRIPPRDSGSRAGPPRQERARHGAVDRRAKLPRQPGTGGAAPLSGAAAGTGAQPRSPDPAQLGARRPA